MHELGITQEIVSIVAGKANGAKIKRVVVEVGKLACVLPGAMRFCFDLCTEGTLAEGATLEIIEVPGRARCKECGGCSDLEWLSGEELRIKQMELA